MLSIKNHGEYKYCVEYGQGHICTVLTITEPKYKINIFHERKKAWPVFP